MEHRISAAACECVASCQNLDNPLLEVSECVHRLLASGWKLDEANEVGRRALYLIDPNHPLLAKFTTKPE